MKKSLRNCNELENIIFTSVKNIDLFVIKCGLCLQRSIKTTFIYLSLPSDNLR